MKKKPVNLKKVRNRLKKQYEVEKKQMEVVYNGITTGFVVDTNDPQEMGRIKVFCPSFGDSPENNTEELPWCSYGSPFGGFMGYGERGSEKDKVVGPVAYGMWNIPKVGASALVCCIDGDPNYRVWIGCLPSQYTPHTMPHGRHFHNDEFFNKNGKPLPIKPDGPFSSSEEPIQPLYKNYDEHFQRESVNGNPKAEHIKGNENWNFEWRTRGADNSVSSINNIRAASNVSVSEIADDDEFGTDYTMGGGDKYVANHGYNESLQNPEITGLSREKNYDSLIYSWTSPGFHSISMDDKPENCRMRMRTTAGHQIIMDDTNERIYISTAKGNNWLEMDQQGNIEFYTEGNFSVHARKDINFTAGEKIKLYAGTGIQMKSEKEIRTHAWEDIHVRTEMNYRHYSHERTFIESNEEIDILAVKDIKVHTDDTLHLESDDEMYIESNDKSINIRSKERTLLRAKENIEFYTEENYLLYAKENIDTFSDKQTRIYAKTNLSITTDSVLYLTSKDGTNNLVQAGMLVENALEIHHNPTASAVPGFLPNEADEADEAKKAEPADELFAYATSKVPEHEPWSRVATNPELVDQDGADNILEKMTAEGRVDEGFLEFDYLNDKVQLEERGRIFERGKFWRR